MFDWLLNKSKDAEGQLAITHDVTVLPSGVRVLRLRCSGYYPPGCGGSSHARQIYEIGGKAFLAADADAVLLDLTNLDYVWGDDLLRAFDIPYHESIERDDCPTAVIVGPKCQEAVQSLIEDGRDDWREANLLFFDEASALEQLSPMHTNAPNHALQRTAPGVTACAPARRPAPAAFPHRLRRPPQSLNLGRSAKA